jgi:hypothetical protein
MAREADEGGIAGFYLDRGERRAGGAGAPTNVRA